VAHVAPPNATTSLEVAAFLTELCDRHRPRRILEIGTGFASAVLRRLGEPPSWLPEIWSVDDDPSRLATTRRFLAQESLRVSRLLSWQEFQDTSEAGFELVVHDLGAAAAGILPAVLERVKGRGLLLLDGAHRAAEERAVRRLLAESGAEYWSLRRLTRDCFGRYALLARL
jgi:protein-L-isoaspartate O-methyltransferase